jgi:hypothetical protein
LHRKVLFTAKTQAGNNVFTLANVIPEYITDFQSEAAKIITFFSKYYLFG